MAKRGRPTKKAIQKKKAFRRKCKLTLFFTILILIAFLIIAYYMLKNQGITL